MGAGRAVKAQQSKSDKQSRRVTRQPTNRSSKPGTAKSSSSKAMSKAVTKTAKPKARDERKPASPARVSATPSSQATAPVHATTPAPTAVVTSAPTPVIKAQPKAVMASQASINMNAPVANDAKMDAANRDKNEPVNVITWDDPKLDRKIIEGMLTDRNGLLNDLATQGITSAAVMRRAADLGLSEAYLRHVQTVAADLAGDRPGARRVPSSLAARDCLSCNRVFLSSGPGNRICPRCRGADAGLASL